jgi:hypothetical protein
LAPFYAKNDPFAMRGTGRSWENHVENPVEKKRRFLQALEFDLGDAYEVCSVMVEYGAPTVVV